MPEPGPDDRDPPGGRAAGRRGLAAEDLGVDGFAVGLRPAPHPVAASQSRSSRRPQLAAAVSFCGPPAVEFPAWAGVVQWQNGSFPSCIRGFDSLHPLQHGPEAMPYSVEGKLVVAISSRALFDFEEENRVFDAQGERAYIDLQYSRMDVPAKEGVAFRLVKKLLAFNCGRDAARRGGDPVEERPGVGPAHLPLRGARRPEARARRVHARPQPLPLPRRAAGRTCSSPPTSRT